MAQALRHPTQGSKETAAACVAVIGAGHIGRRHLEVFGALSGVRTVVIPARAETLKYLQEVGIDAAATLEAALKDGVTHAVIATDTKRHLEDCKAALAAGLSVLAEKPLTVNAADAAQLAVIAKKSKQTLAVGCVLRFSDSLNTFREWLPRVGKVHDVDIACQSYLPDWRRERPYKESYSARADEGGVLRDLIHEVDYAGWLFGWPKAVHGWLRNLGRLGIESEEIAQLRWENLKGVAVNVRLDYLTRPARRLMRAFGENGTLVWDGIVGSVTLWGKDGHRIEEARPQQTKLEMFRAQAEGFLRVGQGVQEPRLALADDGVRALAVCDAARRSSSSSRLEKVEDF